MSNYWPTRNSVQMNSLFYSSIQKTPIYFSQKDDYLNGREHLISEARLPLHCRQQTLDYFLRERIEVNADLVCELLNGSINYFDLWGLCEINNFSDNDIRKILNQLTMNSSNLIELTIGGLWIYNAQLMENSLKQLFKNGDLAKLERLKLQQANNSELVYLILKNCVNLTKFEIKEPSITDQQIENVVDQLIQSTNNNQFQMQELTLPSSVRNNGLFDCFKLFKNLTSISCSNFEPILDFLDDDYLDEENYDHSETNPFKSSNYKNQQFINQLKQQLEQLKKLTITNPMGKYAVEQIINYCPNIEELNLEVQEIMHLKAICKLKHLKSLSLHNSPNLPTSFLTEVLPILEDIGHQFISLSLEQFEVLDLSQINKLCPELNSLSAQWFTLLSVSRTTFRAQLNDSVNVFAMSLADRSFANAKSNNEFSNLLHLRLRPRLNRDLSTLAVEYLIRNAKQLQYLELYCCKQFNDALLMKLFEVNGFKRLKYLIIRNCNDLNRTTIASLLSRSSQLQYVELDKPVKDKTELIPLR